MTLPSSCNDSQSDACHPHFETVSLAEAMLRFRAEAQQGTVDTGRYRCRFFSWGAGPTLAFVPGLVDDAQAFLLLTAHLSRYFRCIAYDWPTGETDGARMARYRHADFAKDLIAIADHVGAAEVFPLGYSFGSTITLAAMNSQPQRFPRAVLLSGFAHRRLAPAEKLLASMARYWPGPLSNLPLRNWILSTNHSTSFRSCADDVWRHYLDCSGSLPMASVARRALILDQVDMRNQLPRIRQPVLLICGDADPLVNKQCETELLIGLPNVARVELTNCGHMAIFTHPAVLAETITQYLLNPAANATGGCAITS